MIQINWDENCRACDGNGFQYNQLTGMNETCQVCGGSGHVHRSNFDFLPDGVYYCSQVESMTEEIR